ncbi:unnamed protein product, partial [Onchocerca ochengi]
QFRRRFRQQERQFNRSNSSGEAKKERQSQKESTTTQRPFKRLLLLACRIHNNKKKQSPIQPNDKLNFFPPEAAKHCKARLEDARLRARRLCSAALDRLHSQQN